MELISIKDQKHKRTYHINLGYLEYISPLHVKDRNDTIYATIKMSGGYAFQISKENYDKVTDRIKKIQESRILH